MIDEDLELSLKNESALIQIKKEKLFAHALSIIDNPTYKNEFNVLIQNLGLNKRQVLQHFVDHNADTFFSEDNDVSESVENRIIQHIHSIPKNNSEDVYNSYCSQFGQDKFINESLLFGKRNGFFVDVGAYDGLLISNTYFFEKILKWSGLCIEPIPHVFDKLKHNRDCTCINGCISDNSETKKFMHVLGGTQYELIENGEYPKFRGGKHTEMLSGLLDYYNNKHVALIDDELDRLGSGKEIINVKCYILNELLSNAGIYHIDYLSIDVEGGELKIVESIDFNKFHIDIISVENLYNEKISAFLKSKGYDFVTKLGYDEIYRKRSHNDPNTEPHYVKCKENY